LPAFASFVITFFFGGDGLQSQPYDIPASQPLPALVTWNLGGGGGGGDDATAATGGGFSGKYTQGDR
jgi:hypothetical protein